MAGLLRLSLCVMGLIWEAGAQEDAPLPFTEILDPGGDVTLKWGFDLVQGNITFQVTARTTGWVGFGFSPNGGMAGSDIVIGGVTPGGSYFKDYYAVDKSFPLVDQEQSYRLLSLSEADGQTVMKFTRSIISCDQNDMSVTDLPMKLIYAYGMTDQTDYHMGHRGTREVNLLKYMPKVAMTSNTYFEMTMTEFLIPAKDTHYQCKVMEAPTFDRKYHIYRIEPIVERAQFVHHLLLYRCPPGMNETSDRECYTGADNRECFQAVAAWGMGGMPFEFPELAGIPIGGEVERYLYRLEVHYSNPDLTKGVVDSSGLRLYYTDKLRKNDAAILQTGLAVGPGYLIPPNSSVFHTYGLCDTAYIQEALSGNGSNLNVFSVLLHTHLAGRKLRVGQFRDDKQIDFLALEEVYNFEMQQTTNLGKTKMVKLGDKLLVECTYNTANRSGMTWGGLATTDEMCLAFLYYYPAMGLSTCVSFPNMTALMTQMGAKTQKEMYSILLQKSWDNTSIMEFEKALKMVPQHTMIGNVYNNFTFHMGRIYDLADTPSSSCSRKAPNGAATRNTGTIYSLLLLLWLAVGCAL
ncbi:DBH-like monooxygenase protein 2 homolog [Denticeps clupeoides]|uniref:DOMON domain-containing protein n=1 Tax=Denticeps clupeoides TaxID=299321 RepID=A0AAY4EDH6_9TELE|nr:DBH-like monooxygenase protein 2 homolog [Denticeps clupeoides]